MSKPNSFRKFIEISFNAGVLALLAGLCLNIGKSDFTDHFNSIEISGFSILIVVMVVFIYILIYSFLNDMILQARDYYYQAHKEYDLRISELNKQLSFRSPLADLSELEIAKYVVVLPTENKELFYQHLTELESLSKSDSAH